MTDTGPQAFDLIGMGFGPSNLALAIALRERGDPIRARLLEAWPPSAWHPDMLIAGSDMQVSFLKDLVSLRNPRSEFSFLNYLHRKGRLSRFINRKTFFPSRAEYNDYLAWVAGQLPVCSYDSRVTAIAPLARGDVITELEVTTTAASGERRRYRARNLVLAPGGTAHWPAPFERLRESGTVLHSSGYLSGTMRLRPGMRIAIIGGGQSAAEIFSDLAACPEAPHVDLILRGGALMPSDDTPFVNEIFDPAQTDRFHALPAETRQRALRSFAATNYAVTDADLIGQIYGMFYEQDVRRESRLGLRTETCIRDAAEIGGRVWLHLDGPDGRAEAGYDLVILATGYRRRLEDALPEGLAEWWTGAAPGRDYRLPMRSGFAPGVFVQGFSEPTHGLSDTLLSVLAHRADEIAETIGRLCRDREMALVAE